MRVGVLEDQEPGARPIQIADYGQRLIPVKEIAIFILPLQIGGGVKGIAGFLRAAVVIGNADFRLAGPEGVGLYGIRRNGGQAVFRPEGPVKFPGYRGDIILGKGLGLQPQPGQIGRGPLIEMCIRDRPGAAAAAAGAGARLLRLWQSRDGAFG